MYFELCICGVLSLNKDVDFKQSHEPWERVCEHGCTNMEELQEEKPASRRGEEASR